MTKPSLRMYDELAEWWPLLSPPGEYEEEAADLLRLLGPASNPGSRTLLELGCGGGSLAFHLKRHLQPTLTDISPGMLAVSRAINPECEHHLGDMRTLRLGREFDVVLIHDAIMYATDAATVREVLRTAALHCRAGGEVAILPDFVRETFDPYTSHGGHDGSDGRALRYLDWVWDPDPADDTYLVEYAFLLRAPDGEVTVAQDRHVEGLFARDQWMGWLEEAGLPARSSLDSSGRIVFVGTRRA